MSCPCNFNSRCDPTNPVCIYYRECDEHEWGGAGECPGCKGKRLADESVDRALTERHTPSGDR